MVKTFNQKTLAELVNEDPRRAAVFQKWGLDFCCGGKQSLQTACRQAGISETVVVGELQALEKNVETGRHDFDNWSATKLIRFILDNHHAYVEAHVPQIRPLLAKVVQVHGKHHPELAEVQQIWESMADHLVVHMKKEELMLFPYIQKLEEAAAGGNMPNTPPFGSVRNPVHVMEAEHEEEGQRLKRLQQITGNFRPPADACNTFQATYALLEEFIENLLMHIHLENNLLFPKAIDLEKQLSKADV
jgi:regulator of cell morphogenesis and NO signaling